MEGAVTGKRGCEGEGGGHGCRMEFMVIWE